MKSFVMNPICVVALVVAGLSLAYLANVQFNKTGTFWPPKNARITEAPSPLDKVLELQHQARLAGGFPYGDTNSEIIGTMFVWSSDVNTKDDLNTVTAHHLTIEEAELLYNNPNSFWIDEEGKLGPHDEKLIHHEVAAILLPSDITATKNMPILVKRHESGFLFGTPAHEEEVLALN